MQLRKVVKEQEEKIENLSSQVDNITQAILHRNKKLFGSSSEKISINGQIFLFNEAENLTDSGAVEPTAENLIISGYKRTPRKKEVKRLL